MKTLFIILTVFIIIAFVVILALISHISKVILNHGENSHTETRTLLVILAGLIACILAAMTSLMYVVVNDSDKPVAEIGYACTANPTDTTPEMKPLGALIVPPEVIIHRP